MMTTNDFNTGCSGRNAFDMDARKQFQEKWSAMTDSEKVEFMDKQMSGEGEDLFSVGAIDARCEKWMKMSAEEKAAFVDERKGSFAERLKRMHSLHHPGGSGFFWNHFPDKK